MNAILQEVARYYSDKVLRHGATPAGVDWNSEEGQRLRFRELLQICSGAAKFSLNDFGCGYGALLSYVLSHGYDVRYWGFDISEAMIMQARQLYGLRDGVSFVTDRAQLGVADYTVASGIFNVKQNVSREEWTAYTLETLVEMNAISARGFSFNMLTSYSDAEKMRPDLYYGDPCFFFDYCKRRLSRDVFLSHDYGLYEFTIGVRKQT